MNEQHVQLDRDHHIPPVATDEATVEQLMRAIREMDSDERVSLRVALNRTVPRFDRPHVSL